MNILVVGTGGVGGYFGGRLAAAGHEVTFVARGAQLEALRSSGLEIRSPRGPLRLTDVRAVGTIAEAGEADVVLVCVKLWDTPAIAPALRPLAERGAAVISLQNGVQKDDLLREHVPAEAVMGGVCYIAAALAGPGIIAHTGQMQRLVFGEYDGRESERARAFLAACQAAGIDAECSRDIERLIWEKFVFLVGLSGATSLYREPIGTIRGDASKRATLLAAMREVVAVGRAKGVSLAADYADDRLAFCDGLPEAMTSSMQLDLARGNRLEMPWLSGAAVALGERLGIETPANRTIRDALAPFVNGGA